MCSLIDKHANLNLEKAIPALCTMKVHITGTTMSNRKDLPIQIRPKKMFLNRNSRKMRLKSTEHNINLVCGGKAKMM